MTIIYVSHRLEEVFDIADRITVMRNGALVTTQDRAATTMQRVVEAMVGTSPAALFPERPSAAGRAAGAASAAPGPGGDTAASASIVVEGLTVDDELRDVSFSVQPGQIVGLAGLEGSGVATLLGVLFGTRRADAGTIRFADGRGAPASPTAAARRRISLVPADRRHQGLMLERSVAMNIAQVAVGTLPSRRPWLDRRAMGRAARRQIEALRIQTDGPNAIVGRLSGGNQQKVVLGKWLEVAPDVFLLDDPTRGVDVGAKREIYRLIRELADCGRTVLFRSTELTEIVGLADRILVLYRGRLAVEIAGGEIDDHGLLQAINTGRRPAAPTRSIRADGSRAVRRRPARGGVPMIRRAFTMRLKPGGLAEYKDHHDQIWQDLVDEIERQGIAQITIFEADPVLFLYSEIRDEEAWDRLWHTAIHDKLGRDHEPADGVQRRGHRRLERASRGVQPRDGQAPLGEGGRRHGRGSARPRRGRHRRGPRARPGRGGRPGRPRASRRRGRPRPRPAGRDGRPRAAAGGRMLTRPTDVADTAAVADLGDFVRDQLGPPTILVNAAGMFGPIALIRDTDPRDWVRTVMVDGIAPFLTINQFVGGMIDAGWGRIVNVTSAASLHPPGPLNSAYGDGQGRPQPADPPPRRGDRRDRRDRQRHPPRRREDRHVAGHPRPRRGDGPRGRALSRSGRPGSTRPAATRRTRRSTWSCA